ncbi:protein of unknown function (plasmid) [Pararobbsia alpina]
MDLFDRLRGQIDGVRLPLVAVTVTAAAQVNTPLFAILHRHGFSFPALRSRHDRFQARQFSSIHPGTASVCRCHVAGCSVAIGRLGGRAR